MPHFHRSMQPRISADDTTGTLNRSCDEDNLQLLKSALKICRHGPGCHRKWRLEWYHRNHKLMRPYRIDPFAEADDNNIDGKESQNYIHIRIQRAYNLTDSARIYSSLCGSSGTTESFMLTLDTERNGRKTLTTVQGLPKIFDQKKILKVIKKKFGK